MDVKRGRFNYQSGRAGDEAKKRKSPAKSGRVGIYELSPHNINFGDNFHTGSCWVRVSIGYNRKQVRFLCITVGIINNNNNNRFLYSS